AVLACGVSFGAMQFFVSNYIGHELTDILSAITSISVMVLVPTAALHTSLLASRLPARECSLRANADEHQHYGLGCLGWYRPISPPPGSRIFVIEPQRSSATMEHSTPFARSASISVLRLSHMK